MLRQKNTKYSYDYVNFWLCQFFSEFQELCAIFNAKTLKLKRKNKAIRKIAVQELEMM